MVQSLLSDAAGVEQCDPIHRCGGVPLLKTLLTNRCENSCAYCANRSGRHTQRAEYSVDEMVSLTRHLTEEGRVRGLFLSSGISSGAEESSLRVVEVAERLRAAGYKNYIHLRLMPGVSRDTILRAVGAADRVGVNVEAADAGTFHELCPEKDYDIDVLRRLRWIAGEALKTGTSVDTQLIVRALEDDDRSILDQTEYLYKIGLSRIHYSGFRPVEDTPLSKREPCPRWRVRRLYQASYLIRDYGIRVKDLGLDENLENVDPKRLLKAQSPLDPNVASLKELMIVPGVGPRLAQRIVGNRPIRSLSELRRLGLSRRSMGYFTMGKTLSDFI